MSKSNKQYIKEYKVIYGKNPMRPKIAYVNANNASEAIKFIMDTYNVYRNMIHMTTWVDTKEIEA